MNLLSGFQTVDRWVAKPQKGGKSENMNKGRLHARSEVDFLERTTYAYLGQVGCWLT